MDEKGFDFVSYILGLLKGKKSGGSGIAIMDEGDYKITDPNGDGNIVITKKEA